MIQNSLGEIYPEILQFWDYEKNCDLTPYNILHNSGKEVYWKCSNGHSLKRRINYMSSHFKKTGKIPCPYCDGKQVIRGFNDLETLYPDIAALWNYEKNVIEGPWCVTKRSGKKVWWTCTKGHNFEATVASMTDASYNSCSQGCPYCDGKQVVRGFNDLETLRPDIAAMWDYERNEIEGPWAVTPSSRKRVCWICAKGHQFESTLYSITRDSLNDSSKGCPYCSGQKVMRGFNDLEKLCPDIAAEWDYAKNTIEGPWAVTAGSNQKIWWICSKGHGYEASVCSRTGRKKCGCPYCSNHRVKYGFNDLETVYPQIATEWDSIKNGYGPNLIVASSRKIVWWRCSLGHRYQAMVYDRTGPLKIGCPYCSGRKALPGFNDLATLYPDVAAEWDYINNKNLTPEKVTIGYGKPVWWRCPNGHSYKRTISLKIHCSSSCPYCSGFKTIRGVTDLQTVYPELAKEWSDKNLPLTPSDISYKSVRKVWWVCPNNHVYIARIRDKVYANRKCPYCGK